MKTRACLALLLVSLTLAADPAPVLISAVPRKSHMELVWQHPSAIQFSIQIVFHDEGMTGASTAFIARAPARRLGTNWTCRVKFAGDTNLVSLAVSGSTNWSNSIEVIP